MIATVNLAKRRNMYQFVAFFRCGQGKRWIHRQAERHTHPEAGCAYHNAGVDAPEHPPGRLARRK